jgi:hypothetical protein
VIEVSDRYSALKLTVALPQLGQFRTLAGDEISGGECLGGLPKESSKNSALVLATQSAMEDEISGNLSGSAVKINKKTGGMNSTLWKTKNRGKLTCPTRLFPLSRWRVRAEHY